MSHKPTARSQRTPKRGRGPCQFCGDLLAITKAGNVHTHCGGGYEQHRCPGSGKPPKASVHPDARAFVGAIEDTP